MTNRIKPEPWLTQHYTCPDCGATAQDSPVDCCDTCILKFYFDDPNASVYGEALSGKALAKTLFDWRMANGDYYGSKDKRERDAFYWAEELSNFLRVNALRAEAEETN
jgi:hypothetical protein